MGRDSNHASSFSRRRPGWGSVDVVGAAVVVCGLGGLQLDALLLLSVGCIAGAIVSLVRCIGACRGRRIGWSCVRRRGLIVVRLGRILLLVVVVIVQAWSRSPASSVEGIATSFAAAPCGYAAGRTFSFRERTGRKESSLRAENEEQDRKSVV